VSGSSDTGCSSNKGPSLDSVNFDDRGFKYLGEEPGRKRVWQTPDGDPIYLFFFPVAPDLPANVSSTDELAAALRRLYEGAQGVCRMHGAKGGAPTGKKNGNYRHGGRTKEAIQAVRYVNLLSRLARRP
jgi:hypothetical protein